MTLHT